MQGKTQSQRTGICQFWDCGIPVRPGHFLCYDHFLDLQDSGIDRCPGCGQFKDVQYETCLPCRNRATDRPGARKSIREPKPTIRRESSPAWEAGDSTAESFFTYILKLDGGKFYAGQTRDLRVRLSEYKDGKEPATRGRNPRLQWFVEVPSRKTATELEVEMKRLINSNERQVRTMIMKFQDYWRLMEFDRA